MPFFLRTTIVVSQQSGLGVGTTIDANGGQVQISGQQGGVGANAPVYTAAQEVGRLVEFAAELQVLAGAGGSITVTLQDSFDGTSWNSWVAFTAVTGLQTNPGQVVAITRNPGPLVRCQAVVAVGGAGYQYKVILCGAQRVG